VPLTDRSEPLVQAEAAQANDRKHSMIGADASNQGFDEAEEKGGAE